MTDQPDNDSVEGVEQRLRRTFAVRGEDMAGADGVDWDRDGSELVLSVSLAGHALGSTSGGVRGRARPVLAAAATLVVVGAAAVGLGMAGRGGGDTRPVSAAGECPEASTTTTAPPPATTQGPGPPPPTTLAEVRAAEVLEFERELTRLGAGDHQPCPVPTTVPPPATTQVVVPTTAPPPPTTQTPTGG